jgi:hypothetical protein
MDLGSLRFKCKNKLTYVFSLPRYKGNKKSVEGNMGWDVIANTTTGIQSTILTNL